MRYTLEELESVVPRIIAAKKVNTMFDGYPILHSVFIELRDERNETKYNHFIILIEIILKDPNCNPDVLDKHKKPLLAYVVEMEKENLSSKLINMLLQAGADPNLMSTSLQYTALEWAVQRNPTSKAINILKRFTNNTPKLLANCQEMFNNALEEDECDIINVLLETQLVHYVPKFRNNLISSNNIPRGFWIRTIADPMKELEILEIRENLDDGTLAKQRHTLNPLKNSHYTIYSPATYVRNSIPISIFSFEKVGLIIHPTDDQIPYWFDGHQEELTRDFSYGEKDILNNGQTTGQYWEVTPKEIQKIIEELYKKEVQKCKEEAQESQREDPPRFDKHGVILDRLLCDISFSWNEGLLRYKHKQVLGILVNPESKDSCKGALKLKSTLKLNVPFYHYNESLGTTHELHKELIQARGITADVTEKPAAKKKPKLRCS